jgi:hypothetical protein
MNKLLLGAAAIALVWACQATPAEAHWHGRRVVYCGPRISVLPRACVVNRVVIYPCNPIINTGYCFPRGSCPGYSQWQYSSYWGRDLYFLPSCQAWVYYSSVDDSFHQITYQP